MVTSGYYVTSYAGDMGLIPPPPFPAFYGAITCVGIIGNVFVICAILGLQRLRTEPNIFVVNLCLADLLLGINCACAFIEMMSPRWHLGVGACKFFGFMTLAPAIAIVYSMVVIARYRYVAVKMPGRLVRCYTKSRIILYQTWVWGLAILINIPILTGAVHVKSGFFCACCFYYDDNVPYGATISLVVFILPNILIAYFYIRIFYHVHRSHRRVEQHAETERHGDVSAHHDDPLPPQPTNNQQLLNKKLQVKLATQFVVLFLIFNLTYVPSMIVFWVENVDSYIDPAIRGTVMIIYACNMIANPVTYFLMNHKAREEVRIFVSRRLCRVHTSPEHVSLSHPHQAATQPEVSRAAVPEPCINPTGTGNVSHSLATDKNQTIANKPECLSGELSQAQAQ